MPYRAPCPLLINTREIPIDGFDHFLCSFQGPDGRLFVDRGHESRIPLSLNVDSFNVQGLRIRGAKTSCTIISMACLSLPFSIR